MNLPDIVSSTSYIVNPEPTGGSNRTELVEELVGDVFLTSSNRTEFVPDYVSGLVGINSNNSNHSAKTTMRVARTQTYMEKTTDFYDTYDPSVGVRTAAVLASFLFFIIGYSLYKTKCRRNRWSQDDKEFIERYSKLLADKWAGKSPPPPPPINRQKSKRDHASMRSSKCSIANTAEWVQSQPLHEVSMLQDTMYKICMESFKATACQVCSLSDLRGPTNLLMKPPVRDSYLQRNSSLDCQSHDSGTELTRPPDNGHIPQRNLQYMDSIDIDLRLPFPKSRSLDEKMHSSLSSQFNSDKPYTYTKLTEPQPQTLRGDDNSEPGMCPMATPDSTETINRQADSSGKSQAFSTATPDLFSPMTIETFSDSDSLDYGYEFIYQPKRARASLQRQDSLDSECEFAQFMEQQGEGDDSNSQSESFLLPHQQICIPEIHNHDDQTSQSSLTSGSMTSEERSRSLSTDSRGDRNNHICIPEIRISCDSLHKTQTQAQVLLTAKDILHAQISKSAERLNQLNATDSKTCTANMKNGDVIIALRDLNKIDRGDIGGMHETIVTETCT